MRIVSLLPSATEIVCALGLEDDLVGVTHECDFPPSVTRKPVLTASVLSEPSSGGEIDRHVRRLVHEGSSIYQLDSDRLAALEPDLILTQELCEVCAVSYPIVEQAVRRLEGPSQLVSLEPETLDDVYETIRTVGRLTGRGQEAEELVNRLCRRIASLSARLAGLERRRTVCLEWVDPPYNAGHWTPELVWLAGGEDVTGTPGRPARPMEPGQLASLRPDVAVVMACGFGLRRSLEEVERLNGQLALAAGQLWVVDGNAYFSRPGPRLVDSVEIMAGILHPDVIGGPPPAAAVRVR